MQNYTLGTVIYIDLGFFRHYGVISGLDCFGRTNVISNSKKYRCVSEESINDFCSGKKVHIAREPNFSLGKKWANRARSQLGKKYNLFSDNCEHFKNWVSGSKAKSSQIQAFVVLASIIFIGWVAVRA